MCQVDYKKIPPRGGQPQPMVGCACPRAGDRRGNITLLISNTHITGYYTRVMYTRLTRVCRNGGSRYTDTTKTRILSVMNTNLA